MNPLAASATVTIHDDDLPTVSLEGTDLIATEYSNLKAATVRRTGSTAAPLTVPLAFGGTAKPYADYQVLTNANDIGGSIVFPPSAATVTLSVKPVGDTNEEPAESIQVTVKGGKMKVIAP